MRTLRQRRDVAGYLRKDASGTYNPKTRAFVAEDQEFVRTKDDQIANLRAVASEVGKHFSDVANPTQTQLLLREREIRQSQASLVKRRKLEELYSAPTESHSSCWGSWFDRKEQRWGYACCLGLDFDSSCTKSS